jgi:hypothetical protein
MIIEWSLAPFGAKTKEYLSLKGAGLLRDSLGTGARDCPAAKAGNWVVF